VTVGDCFAGIGGMSLGLERAGMTIRWQVEVDPYARTVLERHWPHVPRRGDIRLIEPGDLEPVDLVVGGFPCVDLSNAATNGPRRGLAGRRSGLWRDMARLVEGLQPRWVLCENTDAWRRWVPAVRADLARLGYASLPVVVSAAAVGAPHARPRAFVAAHADGEGEPLLAFDVEVARLSTLAGRVPWPDQRVGLDLDDGIPDRLAALKALGNACVSRVAEVIGQAILAVA